MEDRRPNWLRFFEFELVPAFGFILTYPSPASPPDCVVRLLAFRLINCFAKEPGWGVRRHADQINRSTREVTIMSLLSPFKFGFRIPASTAYELSSIARIPCENFRSPSFFGGIT